jgi:RNA polymerase sigma-70 factor (ECF subfamily)
MQITHFDFAMEGILMNPPFPSNESLLERYQSGDFEGFDLFYRRNSKIIFAFLLTRLRFRADAEEAFQDTFLKIHKAIEMYDPSQSALGWVFTIAKNAALDIIRRRRRQPVNFNMDELSENSGTEESISAKEELAQLMEKISDAERMLLKARFLDEEPFENIADDLGISADNARQKLSRLLKKIKSPKIG